MLSLVFLLVAAAAAEECQLICPMNWEPQCGTDGHTYSNLCEMYSTACLKKKTVAVSYAGECVEPCNTICQFNYEPVCGSDGHTYGNDCELTSTACMKKNNVRVLHQGECGSMNKKQIVTKCSMACQMNYDPVCGSDMRTYGNACELEQFNCMKKTNVRTLHQGECGSMNKKQIVTKCSMACQMNYDPVCGSDKHTYGNACELEQFNCMKKMNIAVAHSGEC